MIIIICVIGAYTKITLYLVRKNDLFFFNSCELARLIPRLSIIIIMQRDAIAKLF